MWIVVLEEDDERFWADDPVGAFTREEAMSIARDKWPKIEEHERLALYRCDFLEEVSTGVRPKTEE